MRAKKILFIMSISIFMITVTSIPSAQAQVQDIMNYNWPYMSSAMLSSHGMNSHDAMVEAGVISETLGSPSIQTYQVSNPIVLPTNISFDLLPDFIQVAYATPVQTFGADVLADSNTNNFQRDEASITVNPLNPSNLVSVSHKVLIPTFPSFEIDCEFSSSFNGGATWGSHGVLADPLFPSPSIQGDPTVATDDQGNHYYSCLGFAGGFNNIIVQKSTDGGVTWSNPATAGAAVLDDGVAGNPQVDFHDKPWITADQDPFGTSPCTGNLYLSWTEFFPFPLTDNPILFKRSTDSGVTWSSELIINPGDNQVSYPFVDPSNGDVYVVFVKFNLGAGGEGKIMIARSTNCGASFAAAVDIDDPWISRFFEFIDETADPPLVREPPEVQGCVDAQGNVLVVWRDFASSASTDSDVYYSNSLDSGATWTTPTVVNAGNPGDQFFPTIHCQSDQAHIAWGDQRFDTIPDTGLFDVFYRSVTPGLVPAFGAELRVTDSTQDATPAGSFYNFEPIAGDYFDSATNDLDFHVIWTDFRTADPSNAPGSRFVDHGDKRVFVGGTPIPIDTTTLLLAGPQMNGVWLIPVLVAAIGIGIVIARKF